MIYRPYPPYPPLPWWMLVTMIPPDQILKCGKKALCLLQEAREKAQKAGKEHRVKWEKRKAEWKLRTQACPD